MKSLVLLFETALEDVFLSAHVTPTSRDLKTIRSRLEHEGLSFLTITLPDLGKHFMQSLESGIWRPTPAFSRRRKESLPAFLQGLIRLVFDVSSGRLLSQPSIDAIEGIQQLCFLLSKVKMECTHERRLKAEHKFIECERDLLAFRPSKWTLRRDFISVCSILYSRVFSDLGDKLGSSKLMPKHGRGATEEGIKGDSKYSFRSWTKRLEREFPVADYISHNHMGYVSENRKNLLMLDKHEEHPVKVVFVPKTLKTPRVIAVEPVAHMFCQQAIGQEMVRLLEQDKYVSKSLHFTDQSVNANMALESSRSLEFSTLDLSEASDRVHAVLVYDLLASQPDLRRAVFACRSSRARLPSGTILPLKKFASMGSALCFPCEAMVFLSLIIVAHLKHDAVRPTNERVHRYLSGIHVYGDDIIVENRYLDDTISVLESVGLKVNMQKTFCHGHFRESCGVEAYNGVNITPIKLRHLIPRDRNDKDALASVISTANQFYLKGYWKTCRYLRSCIEGIVGFVPHVRRTSNILGWHSHRDYSTVFRWNRILHRFEVYGKTIKPRRYKSPLAGNQLLLKWFLTAGGSSDPSVLGLPLNEYSLKYSTVMRGTWAPT